MPTEELTAVVTEEADELIDIRPDTTALAPMPSTVSADLHPAYVYLASLSVGSHRIMTHELNTAAVVLTGGRCDLAPMPWHLVRYQHTAALRAWLLQNVSASTGNKTLSAVRGALRESWRLGQMTAEQYHRAIDVKPIKGSKPDQAEAGVEPFSPHDLRRTFAGDLLDAGAAIATVQKLMGHANANTTAGYDRRTERVKRDAVSRLHMAWSWKGKG